MNEWCWPKDRQGSQIARSNYVSGSSSFATATATRRRPLLNDIKNPKRETRLFPIRDSFWEALRWLPPEFQAPSARWMPVPGLFRALAELRPATVPLPLTQNGRRCRQDRPRRRCGSALWAVWVPCGFAPVPSGSASCCGRPSSGGATDGSRSVARTRPRRVSLSLLNCWNQSNGQFIDRSAIHGWMDGWIWRMDVFTCWWEQRVVWLSEQPDDDRMLPNWCGCGWTSSSGPGRWMWCVSRAARILRCRRSGARGTTRRPATLPFQVTGRVVIPSLPPCPRPVSSKQIRFS